MEIGHVLLSDVDSAPRKVLEGGLRVEHVYWICKVAWKSLVLRKQKTDRPGEESVNKLRPFNGL